MYDLFVQYTSYIESLLTAFRTNYSEIFWNAIWAIIVFIIATTTGALNRIRLYIIWMWNRLRGKDRYGPLYGKWKLFRLDAERNSKLWLQADIEVNRSILSAYPPAVFNTKHVKSVTDSKGICRIVSGNIFFIFNSSDTGDAISRSPFLISLIDGDDENANLKYGSFCGVSAADGTVYFGDCLLSRDSIDGETLVSMLSKTKKISRADALWMARKSKSTKLVPTRPE